MRSYFTINVSVASLYRNGDFDSPVVTQALLGESCTIIDESEKWFRIRQPDHYEGWINKFYGVISDTPYVPNITCHDLRGVVLSNPNSKVPMRELTFGAKLSGKKLDQGWAVILPDGIDGWTEANLGENSLDLNRSTVVNLGKKFIGIQYLWGGKSPKGFDCSGLIQTIFIAMGVVLPRDSGDQSQFFAEQKIKQENAVPGDLHFFGHKQTVTHVAMELGNDQYLHCQGWVKEESFSVNHPNYNENLSIIYKHTVSTEKVFG
ncbi:MAG: C40 family peptidase [Candidatus Marinimicrobia bacterium]|nr:C40 family peptidase [Candidatus Neomarinimicrobiota bacterium]MBL7031033.1 C40 family peptidase [Candidatus Neomarinimicrobiota bacterium]